MENIIKIWLSQKGMPPSSVLFELYGIMGGTEGIYRASREDYMATGLLTEKETDRLCDKSTAEAEKIYTECRIKSIEIMDFFDERYPERLKELIDAPILLYYKGRWKNIDENISVAVVGQRKATAYGRALAEKTGYTLAQSGSFVISGLAAGIDGAAHRGALKADGYTIGVLGTGIDVYYPVENAGLMRTMFQQGLVISEFPPGTQGRPYNFPRRNRIVSALSKGVYVVEAETKSGSLITARLAREQGRDVFATVGQSEGCKKLLVSGMAVPVEGAKDIINYYGGAKPLPKQQSHSEIEGLSKEENEILRLIALGQDRFEIARSMKADEAFLNAKLIEMEIKGLVIRTGHFKYQIPGKD